jgi:single-strand DNA-binding protein
MNRISLIGNVTKDVELQEKNGVKYARFALAVNCGLEKDGAKHVDFFNCVAFRAQAETLAKYVKKGAKLAIIARMTSRTEKVKDVTVTYWTAQVENFEFLPGIQAAKKPVEPAEPADDLPF